MEDLLSLVVIILYFVLSASASKKKKENKRAKRGGWSRRAQFEQAFERMASQMTKQQEPQKAPEPQAQPRAAMRTESYGEGEDPCHAEMLGEERASLHLRTVSQLQMDAALEGEDPCHAGGAPLEAQMDEEYSVERSPIFNPEDADAFARDVLRGVIMSEILARPGERRGPAGMKRGA